MKFIYTFMLLLVTSCSFIQNHPELIEDLEKVETDAVNDASIDAKKAIDNKSIKQ